MGNRAVITTRENFRHDGIGIYLHWNGGRDSIEAFLEYCKLKGYREPDKDNYGFARLCQVIANFFGGTASVGIDTLWHLDLYNSDNGVYIIEGWEIVDRVYFNGDEQMSYGLTEMLLAIDKDQPAHEQLGKEFIEATPVLTSEIEVGDMVYIQDFRGTWSLHDVIGIGEDKFVNGRNVWGVPFVGVYGFGDYSENVNNYIFDEKVKVLR